MSDAQRPPRGNEADEHESNAPAVETQPQTRPHSKAETTSSQAGDGRRPVPRPLTYGYPTRGNLDRVLAAQSLRRRR